MSRPHGPNPPLAPQQRRPQAEYDAGARTQQPLQPGRRPLPAAPAPQFGARTTPPQGYPQQGYAQPAPQQHYQNQPHLTQPPAQAQPPLNGYGYQNPAPHPAPEPPQFQWTPAAPGTQPPAPPVRTGRPPVYHPEPQDDPYGAMAAHLAAPHLSQPAPRSHAPQPAPQHGGQHNPQLAPQSMPPAARGHVPPQPANYDLGSYALPPDAHYGQPQQGGLGGRWQGDAYAAAPQGHHAPQGQHQPQGQNQGYGGQPGMGTPQPFPDEYNEHHAGNHNPGYQSPQQGFAGGQHDQDYDEQDDGEYETEPRRSRRWLILAALIGSIGVGGGMAYGYKMVFAAKPSGHQVVKVSHEPAKTAPDNPGGKRFANADDKYLSKLNGDDSESNGVRRVQTVTVGGPTAQPQPQSRPSAVPGMTIVGGDSIPGGGISPPGITPPTRTVQSLPPPGTQLAPPPAPPMAPPQRMAMTTVSPAAGGPPRAITPSAPPAAHPPVTKAVLPKQKVKTAPAKSGNVVAVLGYQKSQIEAMKMLADLQQKYDVLRDKQLNVVESDQSARGLGMIYRVVVGPGGTAESAKNLCAQLIQAGHSAKECYTIAN